MGNTTTLYDEDFVAWSKQQAEALRAAARDGTNQQLDWGNLAEEIEDLGKRERHDLGSRISTIIEQLVKLEHSPAKDPRNGWRQTVRRNRLEIERILGTSPASNAKLPTSQQWKRGVRSSWRLKICTVAGNFRGGCSGC